MLRLIIALVACYVLFPTVEGSNSVQPSEVPTPVVETPAVSTFDTLSAASSVIQDVSDFCERNEEACITGSILISNAHKVAKSTLNELFEEGSTRHTSLNNNQVSE